jgi:hypothetical protein
VRRSFTGPELNSRLVEARKIRAWCRFNSFSEYAPRTNPETKKKDVVWFALDDEAADNLRWHLDRVQRRPRYQVETGSRSAIRLWGRSGRSWCETDEHGTDRETLILDLISGQYNSPVRIVAFNTVEGWSRDVTVDIADEPQHRDSVRQRRETKKQSNHATLVA